MWTSWRRRRRYYEPRKEAGAEDRQEKTQRLFVSPPLPPEMKKPLPLSLVLLVLPPTSPLTSGRGRVPVPRPCPVLWVLPALVYHIAHRPPKLIPCRTQARSRFPLFLTPFPRTRSAEERRQKSECSIVTENTSPPSSPRLLRTDRRRGKPTEIRRVGESREREVMTAVESKSGLAGRR